MKLQNIPKVKNNRLFLIGIFLVLVSLSSGAAFFEFTQNHTVSVVQLQPKFIKSSAKIVTKVATNTPVFKQADNVLGVKAQVINIVTDKGNDLLVLVNKKISLSESFVPENLVSLLGVVSANSGAYLRSDAAAALKEMFTSAQGEGLNMSVLSAYRSYAQQILVFNSWVASAGLNNAESFSARAGHSQHQLGTAVDIGATGKNPLNDAFGLTPEGVWLTHNASKFGFVLSYPSGKEAITGYKYEPWHYRYIGKENAQKLLVSGLILEEYLQQYGIW